MIIKSKKDIPWHEITDEKHFLNRRQFIQQAALGSAALSAASLLPFSLAHAASRPVPPFLSTKLAGRTPGPYATTEEMTPYEDVTRYNNFYEFGTDKGDPVENAQNFRTDPWSVKIEGLVEKPGTYTLEDILKPHALEDRIYRMRCVEAWSMVVPWVGFPLADLIKRFQPTSKARYVEFTTLHDPKQMPGQASRFSTIDWPYVEGLRMDEAMHPLTILAVGVYGKAMPPQNGAPIRLVVPWKYGFKSIKSIVSIRFRETKPYTTWNLLAPREYGFYANVNPTVDHPRWSQKIERRLPSSLFNRNTRKTLMFNGYAEEVGHLYSDLDLKRFY